MKNIVKALVVCIYLFLALFIRQTNVSACENNILYISQKYYISQSEHEMTLTSNSKKDYYVILQNRNRAEIITQQNKHNDLGYSNFINKKFAYNIPGKFFDKNVSYTDCISLNISKNIEYTIYTRAP